MRFLVVTIVFLCSKSTIWASDVPTTEGCPKGPIYSHPTECSKYLVCSHGNIEELQCPHGLLFDTEHGICNYAESVVCKKEEKPVTQKPIDDKHPPEENETPNKKYCLSTRGQFPHPTNCKKYYDCWDETILIRSCPDGMLFDAKKVFCDHSDVVQCFINNKPDDPHQPVDEVPDKRYCLSARGQFPHPTNCRKYYNCWDENVVISECPAGTAFDPKLHHCVDAASTTCQTKTILQRVSDGHQKVELHLALQRTVESPATEPKKQAQPKKIDNECRGKTDGIYATTDCAFFIKCVAGASYRFACPANLSYDEKRKRCEHTENVPRCKKA